MSSLRTCEWGVSRHRNTAAITVGGCRGRVAIVAVAAGAAVPWPGRPAQPAKARAGWPGWPLLPAGVI